MIRTISTVTIPAKQMIAEFGYHCRHQNASVSFRITEALNGDVAGYLHAESPAELIELAEVLQAAAEDWEARNDRMG